MIKVQHINRSLLWLKYPRLKFAGRCIAKCLKWRERESGGDDGQVTKPNLGPEAAQPEQLEQQTSRNCVN